MLKQEKKKSYFLPLPRRRYYFALNTMRQGISGDSDSCRTTDPGRNIKTKSRINSASRLSSCIVSHDTCESDKCNKKVSPPPYEQFFIFGYIYHFINVILKF